MKQNTALDFKDHKAGAASATIHAVQQAIILAGQLPDVQREVEANFANNRWWPAEYEDPILRMLLAGLSTRVSYSNINSYTEVTKAIHRIGSVRLGQMSEAEFCDLVRPIGLGDARWQLWCALMELDKEVGGVASLKQLENDDLIKFLQEKVKGVGYKVAQAMVVCLKGYYCGVFIVDSGLKDIFASCIGITPRRGPIGHEDVRVLFERAISEMGVERVAGVAWSTEIQQAILKGGIGASVWFAHLILIYFKRLYCNKAKADVCPLATSADASLTCNRVCLKRRRLRTVGADDHS